MIGTWTVDRMPANGVVAFNAGQFSGGDSWGWLVRDGVESQPPGSGSLGMSFVVDRAGKVSLVTPGELPSIRSTAVHAFKSYPTLLVDGHLPWELQAPARGVDLAHRDSRLAVGTMSDGSIVVVITRFGAVGRPGETVPWGPSGPGDGGVHEIAGMPPRDAARRGSLEPARGARPRGVVAVEELASRAAGAHRLSAWRLTPRAGMR